MTPETRQRPYVPALIIAANLAAITVLVYVSGGADSIAIHFYYLVIVYAGFALGDWGAIIVSLAAASLCGPHMPTRQGDEWVQQGLYPILVRTLFFFVVGIVSSRVAGELHRRAAEFQTLYEVALTISSSLRLTQVLQRIAEAATRVMGARACTIRLLDDDGKELRLAATHGLSDNYLRKGTVSVEASELDQAVLSGQVVAVWDAPTDSRFQYPAAASEEGLTSLLSAPLQSKGRTIGVIRIYSLQPHRFLPREVALASAFASQAAMAIENAELYEDLQRSYFETVRALTRAIEARDPATFGHSERVMKMSAAMAWELGYSQEAVETIRFGAVLHDIGKIGLEESALAEARTARPDGDVLFRLHPLIGQTILSAATFLKDAIPIVLHHHERWDGKGFPEGLAREEIPVYARLVAVVNAYDNLVQPLDPQVRALPPEQALAEITAGAGSRFDPRMVAVFRRVQAAVASETETEEPTAQALSDD